MRNRVIQSDSPFVAPTDDIADLEFASRETQHNTISDNSPKTQHHEVFLTDPNEEHSDEVMFDDEGVSITAPQLFSSFHFPSKPSSSSPIFDFGLSSSPSELVDEEIKIDYQIQTHFKAETESIPKKVNVDQLRLALPNRHQTKMMTKTSLRLPPHTHDH